MVATTPGGIGEMALTAQALQLGVPIVTAFHAIRMAAVVITVGSLFRVWQWWWRNDDRVATACPGQRTTP